MFAALFWCPGEQFVDKGEQPTTFTCEAVCLFGRSRSAVSLSINWPFCSLPTQTLLVERLRFIHFGLIIGGNFKIFVPQDFLGLTSALKNP